MHDMVKEKIQLRTSCTYNVLLYGGGGRIHISILVIVYGNSALHLIYYEVILCK